MRGAVAYPSIQSLPKQCLRAFILSESAFYKTFSHRVTSQWPQRPWSHWSLLRAFFPPRSRHVSAGCRPQRRRNPALRPVEIGFLQTLHRFEPSIHFERLPPSSESALPSHLSSAPAFVLRSSGSPSARVLGCCFGGFRHWSAVRGLLGAYIGASGGLRAIKKWRSSTWRCIHVQCVSVRPGH